MQTSNYILNRGFQLADLAILVFSFGAALLAVHSQSCTISLEQFLAIRISLQNAVLFLGLLITWHLTFSLVGLYNPERLSSLRIESIDVIKATTLGTAALYIASVVFDIILISPLFLAVFWTAGTVLTIGARTGLRVILDRAGGQGITVNKLLIVGTNTRAVRFARKILNKAYQRYELLGFVDTRWANHGDTDFKNRYPLIPLKNLDRYLRENVVDEVIVCLPVKSSYGRYTEIIDLCAKQGILVRILADFFFISLAKSRLEYFEDSAVMTLYTGNMNSDMLIIKRMVDIMLSLILMVVLSPLFLITAAAIKCTSPGPVFFVQERLGLNKRLFRLYKFRTMVPDAEKMQKDMEVLNEADGPVFKIKDDPRITPIGRFLRKSSIDELPQLFNVLKGDMSLVGPRPLPVRD